MAGPTWRNVDAPQFDMRSMFQATQNMDNVFGRLGDALNTREEKLRTEATDAALAQGYAAQDPEAVAAMMAKGVGGMGPRVNGRAFMETMAKYKADLINSGLQNEQRLNIKDEADNSPFYSGVLFAGGNGDRQALGTYAATPGMRNLAKYMGLAVNEAGQFDVRKETKDNNLRQDENADQDRARAAAADRMQHSASMASIGLQRERFNYDKAQDAARLKKSMEGDVAFKAGQNFSMDRRITGFGSWEDTQTILRRDPGFQKLNEIQQQSMLAGAQSAWDARFARTSLDNNKAIPGLPSGESVAAFNERMSRENTTAATSLAAIKEKYYRNDPALKAYVEGVEGQQGKSKTWDDVQKEAKASGMYFSEKTVDRLKGLGLSPGEASKVREAYGIRPQRWFEWGNDSESRPGQGNTSMGDQWIRAAEIYSKKKDSPEFIDQRQKLENDLQPIRSDILTSIALAERNNRVASTDSGPDLTTAIIQENLRRRMKANNDAVRNGSKWKQVSGK